MVTLTSLRRQFWEAA